MSVTIHNFPFCSHDDIEIDEVGASEFAVTCTECRCSGPVEPDVMSAIQGWNKAIRKELAH